MMTRATKALYETSTRHNTTFFYGFTASQVITPYPKVQDIAQLVAISCIQLDMLYNVENISLVIQEAFQFQCVSGTDSTPPSSVVQEYWPDEFWSNKVNISLKHQVTYVLWVNTQMIAMQLNIARQNFLCRENINLPSMLRQVTCSNVCFQF